jgi:hypothetical protein
MAVNIKRYACGAVCSGIMSPQIFVKIRPRFQNYYKERFFLSFWWESLNARELLEELDVNEKIILK